MWRCLHIIMIFTWSINIPANIVKGTLSCFLDFCLQAFVKELFHAKGSKKWKQHGMYSRNTTVHLVCSLSSAKPVPFSDYYRISTTPEVQSRIQYSSCKFHISQTGSCKNDGRSTDDGMQAAAFIFNERVFGIAIVSCHSHAASRHWGEDQSFIADSVQLNTYYTW